MAVMAFSLVSYVGFFAFVRFGYNSSFFSFFNDISGSNYLSVMTYTAASVVVEVLNMAVIEVFVFIPRQLSTFQRLYKLMCNSRFRMWVLIVCGTLACNVFAAHVQVKFS